MILVAGSANLDFVVRVPHIPGRGETVLGRDLELLPGGKGANQAVACARAGGVPTEMLLATGAGWLAEAITASLSSAGVRMHHVRAPDRRSGMAFIWLSDDAENAITVAPGANEALTPEDLPDLSAFSYLLLQLETPIAVVTAYARAAKKHNVKVVLNAAPARQLPSELLAAVDILIVNEAELDVVAGESGSIAAGLDRLNLPCVIVTLGARGCCAKIDGAFHAQPAFEVAARDTTAAGDTFCGALVAALDRGDELSGAMVRASAAAALACTRIGPQASIPTRDEVAAFLENSEPARAGDLRTYCGFSE